MNIFSCAFRHPFWLMVISVSFFSMCSSSTDSKMDTLSDDEVFELSQQNIDWVFFAFSDDTLTSAESSGHLETRLRTRYNEAAQTQLNSEGIVREDAEFPEDALIVKDLYDDSGAVETVAIMYKKPGADVADEDGWVWGYYDVNGVVKQSVTTLGVGCRSCHSAGIDFTMMNNGHVK